MRQTSFADLRCSLARSLEVAGDWWTPLILRDVFAGLGRFDEILEDLGISAQPAVGPALRPGHRRLTSAPYGPHPKRVEYRLTESGRELAVVLMALTAWGDRWQTPEGGPPLVFSHHDHICRPSVRCEACGEPIDAEDVRIHPGPGGRPGPGARRIGERLDLHPPREDDP